MNARWASWRRDLLFALAGVVLASAVLVPVGWSQVCAERQRAEAAEEAARVERERADRDKVELEKLARVEAARRAAEEELEALAERRQRELERALLGPLAPRP